MNETVTLAQAKSLVLRLAARQSLLLLSAPGVGKSDIVAEAAAEAGLQCRSLLGTQIAPEDVSGIPRIVGERSVFCPPRVLLPEDPRPFCLFLDELPACAPDVQKAFYSLLLERRLGEHKLPEGTWVVAAGNRTEDRSLVRSLSSALINRVTILHIRADANEWQAWAELQGIRQDVRDFLKLHPHALQRPIPPRPAPFSTPRAWTLLAQSLDRVESAGLLSVENRLALAFGRVSAEDAAAYCSWVEAGCSVGQHVWQNQVNLDRPLAELELSVRATNCLESEGIVTIRDLVTRSADELLEVRNFGETTLLEVKEKLSKMGLSLSPHSIGIVPNKYQHLSQTETTLSQAKSLIRCLADEQSLLLLSAPGAGKSDAVAQAAAEAGLPCRSLLGTQIAPEDVGGIPRIVGERSVFCPPRVLLPEIPEPFCLFLDELPACAPDIQKAFYSLLLERRLGEHVLPKGTWVVAAGNRQEDRALVRSLSAALINRVCILNIRVDFKEWMTWAVRSGVRGDVRSFLAYFPDALMRPAPAEPVPFSTPRAWASLSETLDLAKPYGPDRMATLRALAFGRVSAPDAAVFCAVASEKLGDLLPIDEYLHDPEKLPKEDTARWFVLTQLRRMAESGRLNGTPRDVINAFLVSLPAEHRAALLIDLVHVWGQLGADPAMFVALGEVTGI